MNILASSLSRDADQNSCISYCSFSLFKIMLQRFIDKKVLANQGRLFCGNSLTFHCINNCKNIGYRSLRYFLQRKTKTFFVLPNHRLFSSLVSSLLSHIRKSQSCDNRLDIFLWKPWIAGGRCRFVKSCKIMFVSLHFAILEAVS